MKRVECRHGRTLEEGLFSMMLRDHLGRGLTIYHFSDDEPIEEIIKWARIEWNDQHEKVGIG